MDDTSRTLNSLSKVAGCGCMIFDSEGKITSCVGSCGCNCPMYRGEPQNPDCVTAQLHAAYQADRFGGKYIYFCPAGLVFCVAQILGEGKSSYLTAGPIMATSGDDYVAVDLTEPFDPNIKPDDEMKHYTSALVYMPSDRITCLSELTYITANHISGCDYKKLISRQEKEKQQRQIGDYVQSVKARLLLGPNNFSPYPYNKEKKLTYAIMTGDEAEARRYLNEILGHIFFASANDLDAIKIRAMELAVIISRAALEGGADVNSIYQFNLQYITDFFALDTIEDVCFSLTKMLHRLTDETFGFEKVKHVDILTRAVSYIRSNYMHKITLEDVAGYVFISPSYLSKLFKDEMKMNFNAYLTSVRIERSRVLLLSDELSIAEVAEMTGFFDQSYFNKVFKRATGVTPKKYRGNHGDETLYF